MAEISKITLPSGNTYDIKDAVARQMISGGVSFIVAWDGTSEPTVANIPAGVSVQYEGTTYTGTLSANDAQAGAFYLVASSTITTGSPSDTYDEYVPVGTAGSKTWEKIGDTQVDLSDVVRSISVLGTSATPDANGDVDIKDIIDSWWSDMAEDSGTNLILLGNESSINLRSSGGTTITFNMLSGYLRTLINQPLNILHMLSSTQYRLYRVVNVNTTTHTVILQSIDAGVLYTATLTDTDGNSGLSGTISTMNLTSSVTLNKQTDVVLGEATTFALTSGAVTHGALTGHTKNALGASATFTGSVTPSLTNTTRYLSASASGGSVSASGDNVTVVTGYASPTTDTFVKSVTAETGKNLVTTTVPNVTGNTSVSIPNVTGNTTVSIPNVTSPGTASTWSFTMGSGANAETLIIGGANSTAPTLGTNLTATNTTLGTNLTATNTTLGTAITVATGSTSATGTGDAVVTGVTVGDSATAITGLGTASTDTVLGTASTFNVTNPTISLTANTSSATGRIQYLQTTVGANSTVNVSVNSADTVTAVTSMPTSTVGTAITVGTNDKVTALTNATDITVS